MLRGVSFPSTARNGEDVVLHRAFAGRSDVVAPTLLQLVYEPSAWSLGDALAAHGWTTRTVVGEQEELRAAAAEAGPLHVLGVPSVHLGADPLVPEDVRPWVLVVTVPSPTRERAPERDGYRHVLFDGVSDLLLAEEHADLAALLGYPAGALDDWSSPAQRQADQDLARWREQAVRGWQEQVAAVTVLPEHAEIHAMTQTLSWRVTRPLRAVRTRMPVRPRG